MHTPPVEAYSPSTTSSLRWSRRITPAAVPTRGVDRLDLHARLPHAPPEGAGHVQATEPVVEYPHARTPSLGLGRQRLGEPVSDLVVLEDVVVEVDPTLRSRDGCGPVIVGIEAVLEQSEPVVVAQRRVANPPQDPFQTAPREAT